MIALLACALISAEPPDDVRSAAILMGQRSYRRRERGEAKLERACSAPWGPVAAEARDWAMAAAAGHRDPEVRWRALRVLRRVAPCPSCYGTARCRECPGWANNRFCSCKATGACVPCRGTGTAYLASWTGQEWPR